MTIVTRKHMTRFGMVLLSASLLASCRFFSQPQVQPTQAGATKTIFSFLGAPGSGKGTLSEAAVKRLGFTTVSTGDLCRAEIAKGSQKGTMIGHYSKTGKLVPDGIITEMVEEWLKQQTGDTPIILDGYPRTRNQAEAFAKMLKNTFPQYRLRVISLQITDEDEVVKRISNRLMCQNCKSIFNRALLKDPNSLVCERCGGKLTQREDDREEVVRKRLADFNKNNNEIIEFYTGAGIVVEPLNASHATPQEIFENFKKMVG